MSKSKNKAAASARRFLPVHQDNLLQGLASGVLPLAGQRVAELGQIPADALAPKAHGFSYGSVGLVELDGGVPDRPYLLLSECVALWLPTVADANELSTRMALFDDTVPEALPARVDATLFSGVAAELPLIRADNAALDAEAMAAPALHRVQKLAGAASMARKLVRDRALPLELLEGLSGVEKAPEEPQGTAIRRLAEGLLESVQQHVASNAIRSADETWAFGRASELIAEGSVGAGLDPLGLAQRLLDEGNGRLGEGKLAAFFETVRKLVDNQLELSPTKLDDTGRIGLRALLVFMLAPKPEQLLRWVNAREEVGQGVSVLASMLAGLHAGLGSVPASAKGVGRVEFLSSCVLAQTVEEGRPALDVQTLWRDDGSRHSEVIAQGWKFAECSVPAPPQVAQLLAAARSVALEARVDPVTGTVTLGGAGGQQVAATIGPSAWVPEAPSIRLSAKKVTGGRGAVPRDVLEQLIGPDMPPVWATRGAAPGEVVLSVELSPGQSLGDRARQALLLLEARAMALGLVPPPVAKRVTRAKKPRSESEVSSPETSSGHNH